MQVVSQNTQPLNKSNNLRKFISNNRIVLSTKIGIVVVKSSEILRCEADRSYCNFYLTDGTQIRSSKSMKFYEEKLREWNFIKVHKSNMVNIEHVEGYVKGKGGSIVLSDNTMVPVSVRKKGKIVRVFTA